MNGFNIHDVIKVTVKTRHQHIQGDKPYITQTLVVHSRSRHNSEDIDKMEITLFSEQGQTEIPLIPLGESDHQ